MEALEVRTWQTVMRVMAEQLSVELEALAQERQHLVVSQLVVLEETQLLLEAQRSNQYFMLGLVEPVLEETVVILRMEEQVWVAMEETLRPSQYF